MEKKNKFEFPEAIIVEFNNEDIIVTSSVFGDLFGGEPGDENQD